MSDRETRRREELLSAALDGELTEAERAEVEAMKRDDPEAARLAIALERLDEAAHEDVPPVPPELRASIRERVGVEVRETRGEMVRREVPAWRRPRTLTGIAGVAAALLIAAVFHDEWERDGWVPPSRPPVVQDEPELAKPEPEEDESAPRRKRAVSPDQSAPPTSRPESVAEEDDPRLPPTDVPAPATRSESFTLGASGETAEAAPDAVALAAARNSAVAARLDACSSRWEPPEPLAVVDSRSARRRVSGVLDSLGATTLAMPDVSATVFVVDAARWEAARFRLVSEAGVIIGDANAGAAPEAGEACVVAEIHWR